MTLRNYTFTLLRSFTLPYQYLILGKFSGCLPYYIIGTAANPLTKL